MTRSQRFKTSSGAELEAVLIPAGNPLPRAPLITLSIRGHAGLGMRDLGSYDAAKLASRGSLSISGTLLIPNRVNGTRDLEAAICTEICSWAKLMLEMPEVGPLGPRSRLSSLAASRLAV